MPITTTPYVRASWPRMFWDVLMLFGMAAFLGCWVLGSLVSDAWAWLWGRE